MNIINEYKTKIPSSVIFTINVYHHHFGSVILEKNIPTKIDKDVLDYINNKYVTCLKDVIDMWTECRMEILGDYENCTSMKQYIEVIKLVRDISTGFKLSYGVSGAIHKWCKSDDEIIKHFLLLDKFIPFEKDNDELVECFEPLSENLADFFESFFNEIPGGYKKASFYEAPPTAEETPDNEPETLTTNPFDWSTEESFKNSMNVLKMLYNQDVTEK